MFCRNKGRQSEVIAWVKRTDNLKFKLNAEDFSEASIIGPMRALAAESVQWPIRALNSLIQYLVLALPETFYAFFYYWSDST